MRITVDKIASSARHVVPRPTVVLGSEIRAKAGAVLVVKVLDEKHTYNQLEDAHGRLRTVHRGDCVVGVLGRRDALRGYAGDVPSSVKVGDILHLLNLGGVIGRCTSASDDVGAPARVQVLGCVLAVDGGRQGEPALIHPGPVAGSDTLDPLPPLVILAGTCMHAGKTAAACALVRAAASRGLRVGAAKLTGVALRRDTLEMEDHGAVAVASFADAGLPSTAGEAGVVHVARGVLNEVARAHVDLIIAELGDGLLGTYGVREILADEAVRRATSGLVVSANDPVAAWGAHQLVLGIGHTVTCFTGPATDNASGCLSIEGSTGVAAFNARSAPGALADHVLGHLGLQVSTLALAAL